MVARANMVVCIPFSGPIDRACNKLMRSVPNSDLTTHGEEPPSQVRARLQALPVRDRSPTRQNIRRNTVLALFAQLTTGAFTAVLMLYLVRALGPDAFGVFALALGIGSVARLAADVGISQSVARFLAESRGDRAGVAALLGAA